jgi:hypothetical protein
VADGIEIPPLPDKRPGERGIGALLMHASELPRDEFGWPYQACFYFHDVGPTRLVTDADGYVLGYRNTAEGRPAHDPHVLVRLPTEVADAAHAAMDRRLAECDRHDQED